MTEYELADLAASVSADSLVFLPLWLSIISCYLLVAWLVGDRLLRSQVILINSLFAGAILVTGLAWSNRVRVAMAYQDELIAMNPARLEIVESWLIPAAVVAITVVTLACFKFMWDVRHPKAE
jgi:uncharacterized membrane protein